MVRSFTGSTVLRLALVATAACSLAACQSKPKPTYPTQTPSGPTAPPSTPLPPSTGPVTGQPVGALPGSAQDFVVNVGDRVYFDTDSHDVREDARPLLSAQSEWLRRYPSVVVRIEGNADERGTREYNLALGARRANSVRDFLVSQGVTAGRISTISFGKESPIDTGSGEESWQKNRNARTAIVSGAR
ncbi:MAG: peptidoglycan-associated lipoprotein Pal [Alphaproteobacteria bacterium]|nr:peptidoglycan-associated lipoprotein Pal [Alphaproteobacteria bacterium]MBU1516215.1 peptidoglycan-associated lipoprotein Pal [Alphaproteobacteria bacterium]MBU2095752.1 peptidoglycan-associated lipoprotein Pal [Alphaproteobacteria bacterium]MBU2152069.1 peptidoglycan-associated lipoprotein Pal [Alphaproteobacteria bacterium]MBU2306661.1 peptidoglycan-associated lipoprotein Pal [Alphaproteobacteria bacterium]